MIRGMGEYGLDLAGTAVGVAKPDDLFDGSKISPGDIIIGIESNGIHSNGFTLARRILQSKYHIHDVLPWGVSLAEELLRPTRIYVSHFNALREEGVAIKGLAHITGSGFRKIIRLGHHQYKIDDLPELPSVFNLIKTVGNIEWTEMFTTFNMGIGMIVIVTPDEADMTLDILSKKDRSYKLGEVQTSTEGRIEIPRYGVVIK